MKRQRDDDKDLDPGIPLTTTSPSAMLSDPSGLIGLISCPDCPSTFFNFTSYQLHISTHDHTCQQCHKSFPSRTFLDLHIDENHNPFLKIKQEQGQKIFKCFVYSPNGCTKVCSTPKKRRLHMIDKHQYPKDFPFEVINKGMNQIK